MSDYGHPLTFGVFLTPASADPDGVVRLAVQAEQVGLDLVTFQDHPYQPAHLDTWTLLSFVAARTSRVRLSPNVANLPLRPPAVLARAVASLDRLSGGRVELGLGAGAFWDAIEAMGGHRLTPAQAVRALDEAIEVIRQMWDTDSRGGVRVHGEHQRVVGAKRGPAPAHPVGIWLGAYKPRMLALTGRRADGWLPSLAYLQPGDLARGNAVIDDAAGEAGRSPTDVRRLLNIQGRFGAVGRGPLDGPAEQWAEELADLALTDGVSTFILATDDPDDLRRYAGEVVPAVLEQVRAERSAPTSAATPPPPTGSPAPAVPPVAGTSVAGTSVPRGAFTVTPTPDDGTRRSAIRVWDEAERPTGPARDDTRTYTAHDLATAQHLVEVHDGLRAELAQLYDIIDQVSAGTLGAGAARSHINTMTIRQNKWTLGTYCESYCRIVTTHHTLEDQGLFPHLRANDARLAPVLDRLEREHHAIHDVLERVDRALVAYVSVDDGTAELRAAVDLLSDTLLSHLSYEERELVEPLARLGM
ncbi:LLM class flavin-dependent oxidoreductase [Micromonospora endolithica]|uniref:LLM class flavin-dependent oxidoreductase n=1 Tax=Micromonospora endolithica TaxID=230091 RepID=A0A3A9ZAY1_9ACTN|nr:LLM class flavin-dependent oxidoreductase [Micromonospora endolithica]RKN45375.1 LLM class flavin-dependent oxidoreductase [Micromonospora endolithica]TWJ22918.1 alkanesulfonate monooxygenase SsuD/methylene tetrahydromethanopterin reductase-like flavin-dependent oxidoreductase (luciferase family) [Micromonospora endolithica]